ncbi:MAG TPA: response regulator [Candidatus Avalokitesvara rifleensis]|uniref:response regulator n=1 Tax=Candidatus Avalokitesvara rifleensis TaxID=3367620 RepID=UPI0027137605|nr:response regulator [Candidatus Brocadiales bacterium]
MKRRRKKRKINKHTILVVDNDPDICEVLQRALSLDGYRVHKALGGSEALRILDVLTKEEDVHVVLLDLVMPDRDGISTLKEINRRWPQLPVIILTGYGTLDTARQAMLSGAYDFLTKPFDLNVVKETICEALGSEIPGKV